MSYDKSIVVSYKADETITEFSLVSVKANGKLTTTEAATDARCIGVAQKAAVAGEMVDGVVSGLTRAIAGATIGALSAAPLFMATSGGKVTAHATSANYSIGRVVPNVNQTSAVANDQVTIIFTGANNLLP